MKYAHVYALFLMFVFCTSCGGQNQTNPPKDNTSLGYSESQLKEAVTPGSGANVVNGDKNKISAKASELTPLVPA